MNESGLVQHNDQRRVQNSNQDQGLARKNCVSSLKVLQVLQHQPLKSNNWIQLHLQSDTHEKALWEKLSELKTGTNNSTPDSAIAQ